MKQNTSLYLILITYPFYICAMQSSFDFNQKQFVVAPAKFNKQLYTQYANKLDAMQSLRRNDQGAIDALERIKTIIPKCLSVQLSEIGSLLNSPSEIEQKKALDLFGDLVYETITTGKKYILVKKKPRNKKIEFLLNHQVPIEIQNFADSNQNNINAQTVSGLFLALYNKYWFVDDLRKQLMFYELIPTLHLADQYLEKSWNHINSSPEQNIDIIKKYSAQAYFSLGVIFQKCHRWEQAFSAHKKSFLLGNCDAAYNMLLISSVLWWGHQQKFHKDSADLKRAMEFLENNSATNENPNYWHHWILCELYRKGIPYADIKKNTVKAKGYLEFLNKAKVNNAPIPELIIEELGIINYQFGSDSMNESQKNKQKRKDLLKEAKEFYEQAVSCKNMNAAEHLSKLYYEEEDYVKSIEYFLKLPIDSKYPVDHIEAIVKQKRSLLDKQLFEDGLKKYIRHKKFEKACNHGIFLLAGLRNNIEENTLKNVFSEFVQCVDAEMVNNSRQLASLLHQITQVCRNDAVVNHLNDPAQWIQMADKLMKKINV